MRTATRNLPSVFSGDTMLGWSVTITFTDQSDGSEVPADLTGYEVVYSVRDENGKHPQSWSVSEGDITIQGNVVSIPDTFAPEISGSYKYDLEFFDDQKRKFTYLKGEFKVLV